jgi:hypothetical protein
MLARDSVDTSGSLDGAVREQRGVQRAVQLRARVVGDASVDRDPGAPRRALDRADPIERHACLADQRAARLEDDLRPVGEGLLDAIEQGAHEDLDRSDDVEARVANAEAAAEIQDIGFERERSDAVDRGKRRLRPSELRPDVHVQARNLERGASRGLRRLEHLLERNAELRALVTGPDRLVRLGLDTGCDAEEHAAHARGGRPFHLLERIENDERGARVGCSAQLVVALVVPVDDQAVSAHTCAARELELAARRDGGADVDRREEAQQGHVRERLRPEHDQGAGRRAAVRADAGADRLLAVDDQRRPERRRELVCRKAADPQAAVGRLRRVGEQLEHGAIVAGASGQPDHQPWTICASPGPPGAPTTTNSAPSGPASNPRIVSLWMRTASHGFSSLTSSASLIRALPLTSTKTSSCVLCV